MTRFFGKVVLVTGASSGLGAATAKLLASQGASVFGVARREKALQAVQSQIAESGGEMSYSVVDIADIDQCTVAVEDCVKHYGAIDCLINAAGSHQFHHTAEVTAANWQQDLAINVTAPFFLSKTALPHLITRGGNIVNVASIAGLEGQPYSAGYCAAKHGLIGMSKSLALEYAKSNVRVNVVCPGGMATPQIENLQLPQEVDFDLLMRAAAMRGMMDAEEVASVIAFLASDDAAAVHGAVYTVDRGKTCG